MNLRRKLKQLATVWQNAVPDGYGGFTYDLPRTIGVRWEDKNELFLDRVNGGEQVSRAVILTHPDELLQEGDMIALGNFTSTSVPYHVKSALSIRSTDLCPLLSGKTGTLKAMV